MKFLTIIILFVVGLLIVYFYLPQPEPKLTVNETNIANETIKIANWNLQIFGDTKASNNELMNFYVSKIQNYDIMFIQGIRDEDGSSFEYLCSMLEEYNCKVSSRAGRSTSKEQYGIIYKKEIILQNFKDYNPDPEDRWERPPIEATFDIDGYDLTVYNIHIKPDDAVNELTYLTSFANTINGNVIVMGDLNQDGNYYKGEPIVFENWIKVIPDGCDSTVAESVNCYDRIYINQEMKNHYISYGIDTSITSDMSDHYIIYGKFKT